MNTKIIAILMAGIVAMAVGVPMAIGAETVDTSANVGDVAPTYSCTATIATGNEPGPGFDGTVDFELVVTDLNGAGDIPNTGWTAEWSGRPAVSIAYDSETTTTKTFKGSDTIPYCTAEDTYTVSFQEPLDVEVCTDDFVVGSYTGFTLNFNVIDYDGVAVNVKKVVTPGSLHNVGNDNMKIKIHATAMTPGDTYNSTDPDNVDMNLDARVPGIGVDLKALPACQWVPFDHEFVCCTPDTIDFSITAPEGTEGLYTGLIEIAAQP